MALEEVAPLLSELYKACSREDGVDDVRRILAENQGAEHWGEERQNRHLPLHVAAENGRLAQIKLLAEAGADLHFNNGLNMSLLHIAAQGGHLDTVKWLAEQKNFDIHAIDTCGYNVLHRAACCGTVGGKPAETVLYLLRRGARTDAIDRDGLDVLTAARAAHFDDTRPNLANIIVKFQADCERAKKASQRRDAAVIEQTVQSGIGATLPVRKPFILKPK